MRLVIVCAALLLAATQLSVSAIESRGCAAPNFLVIFTGQRWLRAPLRMQIDDAMQSMTASTLCLVAQHLTVSDTPQTTKGAG